MPDPKTPEKESGATAPAPAPAAQQEVVLNDKPDHSAYSNFARVTATPEEVIIDFCLNPSPFAQGRVDLDIAHRLIMNFYTAKRLLSALGVTIQRHEQMFGAIELNVNRRVSGRPGS